MDQIKLKALLTYDKQTGVFRWRVRKKQMRLLDIAGSSFPTGYRKIVIDGKPYLSHRLAWLYVHGEWPPEEIDHINCDPSDNRIANLRLATIAENKRNSRLSRRNTTGFKGVCFEKDRQKWRADIRKDGRMYNLGRFSSPEEAHAAYCHAAARLHGEFARTA